jgi:oligopeptide transport system substrate-binding protein
MADSWKKWAAGAAGVAVLAGGTYAAGLWGGNDASSDKALNFAIPTELPGLDSSKVTDTYAFQVLGNTQEGLARLDADGNVQPAQAEKIEASDDGLTWTITLRDGLKWSNGDDVTAQDYVYSWQRTNDPKTGSEYAYIFSGIENADKIQAGDADVDTLGIKAEDDKTLVVTLEKPMPQFESLLAFPTLFAQNQKFVEEQGSKYGTSAETQLYNGPFKLEGWTGTNNSFKLVKNADYWDADSVKSEEVNIQVIKKPETAVQLYKQGKLDRASLGTPELVSANKNDDAYKSIAESTVFYFQYNQDGSVPALENKKIRQALNLATNREDYVKEVTSGVSTAATGLTPKGTYTTSSGEDFAEYAAQDYKFDADEAKKLWEEGLKEIGESEVTLTITSDADSPTAKSTLDYIQGQWQDTLPGLTIKQKFVPFQQRLTDSTEGNFEIVMSGWGADYPEPSSFLTLFTTDAPNNNGSASSSVFDAAVKKALGDDALDNEKREADYRDAEKAIFDEAMVNPLYWRASPALQNPAVKGLIENAAGAPTTDYKYAYKE